jgi:glycosyltransferase involved in cell wall biosynthesis
VIRVVHLMASPFYGGPERQVLGLARHLPAEFETHFLSFAEGGRAKAFLDEARRQGFAGETLKYNFPRLSRSVAEIVERLERLEADVLCCSGYKPDLLGWRAARRVGIPVVVISHGWTTATWKVRLYERLDRWAHRHVDAVVSVSEAQALKVEAAGVRPERNHVIANAVDEDAFAVPDPTYRKKLLDQFASPPELVVGAAGRLSPEKGFDQLIESASRICGQRSNVGFAIFGEGPKRLELERQIASHGLQGRVVLAGFRDDAMKYLPHFDVGVLSSHTEGLPVILLELAAAGVPVAATTVGGIPEVITDGVSGLLVPPGQPAKLADGIERLLAEPRLRKSFGESAREVVRTRHTFARQSEQYQELFQRLAARPALVSVGTMR